MVTAFNHRPTFSSHLSEKAIIANQTNGYNKLIIINNRYISWTLRAAVLLLLIGATLITATISLQYRHQKSVDQFFTDPPTPTKNILIIRTGNHWITASGNNKKIYTPLLSKTLGAYRSHRYLGWYADYKQWKKGLQLPFALMYEVTYDKAIINESFYFSGEHPSHLLAREVSLDIELN
ncbi:hypothetical protein ACH42_09590 [Endozoicomonas sp. (ex Bugula neritina AB1)]|nr:hypothetical protein ACH42_09590 [Endozoicomonas sp. (ex Bugula neritina AB1)]